MENIIKIGTTTVIMNGGDPLDGCPKSFEEADKWAEEANKSKDEHDEPRWSFDCGFKLDFDGPLMRVSSRFYPPKTHYGPNWDGTVSVYIMGEKVEEAKFNCMDLDSLRNEVENYIKGFRSSLIDRFWKSKM